jgi:hypothetical protein
MREGSSLRGTVRLIKRCKARLSESRMDGSGGRSISGAGPKKRPSSFCEVEGFGKSVVNKVYNRLSCELVWFAHLVYSLRYLSPLIPVYSHAHLRNICRFVSRDLAYHRETHRPLAASMAQHVPPAHEEVVQRQGLLNVDSDPLHNRSIPLNRM